MGITVKYKDLSGYAFQSAMSKLSNCTFKDGGRCAYLVKKMNQAIKPLRDKIAAEYKAELMGVYGQPGEDGKLDERTFKPIEGKEEEFTKAQEDFGERSAEIDRPKFLAADIKDANLTADEQEAIDPILDDSGFEKMASHKQGPARIA